MKYVKTLSSALALSMGLSAATCMVSQEAQAGIAFMGGGVALAASDREGGTGMLGVGLIMTFIGGFFYATGNGLLGLLILDADGNIPSEKLTTAFAARYPFIDNTDVLSDMTQAVIQKFKSQGGKNSKVTLDENEVRAILAPTDLNDAQLAQVIADLG